MIIHYWPKTSNVNFSTSKILIFPFLFRWVFDHAVKDNKSAQELQADFAGPIGENESKQMVEFLMTDM